MAVGTTANEAFHSEINKWFSNQPEIYTTTVMANSIFMGMCVSVGVRGYGGKRRIPPRP